MNFKEEVLSNRTDPNKDDFNHEKIRQWGRWKKIQRKTYVRDKFICKRCIIDFTMKRNMLTINHKIPVREDKTKWFDIDNLETLCKDCHRILNMEEKTKC